MHVHLFGAATPTGEALRQLASRTQPTWPLHAYTRQPVADAAQPFADLSCPSSFLPASPPAEPSLWISVAPIWLLAPFLQQLARQYPERLQGLRGVIACSSSSVLTKRYATNRFDRELVARLCGAEEQLLTACQCLQLPCRILQPTLIYGRAGAYSDRNLSRLLQGMRRLPVLPVPADPGLRQPIHASQLAAVLLRLAQQLADSGWDSDLPQRLPVGGDVQLTYTAMLDALRQVQPPGDPARRCRLLPIPNRLYWFLCAPMLLRSPKAFEAVLRMGADLAGFTPAHRWVGTPAQSFPVLPLG